MQLLSSRHPWHIGIGEQPPPILPSAYDTVRVRMALGLRAIDDLVDIGSAVGPLRYCLAHRQLDVPVESGTTNRWLAPHSVCTPGPGAPCPPVGHRSQPCVRLWVAPPHPFPSAITAADALHHALSLGRSPMQTAHRPPGPHRPEVCHA